MNTADENGNPPLWLALESGQEDVASTMVRTKTLFCFPSAGGDILGVCAFLHRVIILNGT